MEIRIRDLSEVLLWSLSNKREAAPLIRPIEISGQFLVVVLCHVLLPFPRPGPIYCLATICCSLSSVSISLFFLQNEQNALSTHPRMLFQYGVARI